MGRTKKQRTEEVAQRAGMSVEEYNASSRERFIAQHGITPEEWEAKMKAEMAARPRPISQKELADIERYKAELRKRKVDFPPNATRDQLIALLKDSNYSGISKVANKVNKGNPATALLRTGVLLAMKINYFKLAGKLRWAFAKTTQTEQVGMSREDHLKITKAFNKLRNIYYASGGKPEKLKQAILEGKGNQDQQVALAGPGNGLLEILGPDIYFSEVDATPLSGLGEPASSATAIGAATVMLTALAAALKSVKAPQVGEATKGSNPVIISDPEQFPSTTEGGMIDFQPSEEVEENLRTEITPEPEKSRFKLLRWVKDNPLPTAGIGVTIAGLLTWAVSSLVPKKKKKPQKALAGAPKRKTPPRPSKTPMK